MLRQIGRVFTQPPENADVVELSVSHCDAVFIMDAIPH